MEVRGRVEYDDEVIHVIAAHLTDASHDLARLSHQTFDPALARADEVARPIPAPTRGHPRDMRVIPRSRDFH